MSVVSLSKKESAECHVKTKFVKRTYDFCWSIEDFPKYPATFCVKSPKFHPIKELTFYATMTNTESRNIEDRLRLDVTFVQESGNDVEVNHLFSFTDSEGKELSRTVEWKHKYKTGSKTYRQNLYTELNQPIVNFKCKMEFHLCSTGILLKRSLPIPAKTGPILLDDLRAMYTHSNWTDLCLKVEDSITLYAHKGILCCRSPVFAKMLKSPIDEKEKDVISITDIKLPIVEGLLEFLYTGVLCNDNFDFVYDLYYAADKYDVSSLRKTCTDVLLAKLDVENACRVLSLADQHSDVHFKDAVMDFIQHHFDDIVKSNSWAEFLVETELLAEVMRNRSQRNKKVNETQKI